MAKTNTRVQSKNCFAAEKYGAMMAIEAYVTPKGNINYTEAQDGKKSRLTFAVTTDNPVFELLGIAEGNPQAYAGKPESHMLYCTAFGNTADKMKDFVAAKARLYLCGRLNRSSFTDRNGNNHETVSLTVFHAVPVTTFDVAPKYMCAVKALNKKGEAFTMVAGAVGKVTYIGDLKTGTRDSYLHVTLELTAPIDAAYEQANGMFDKNKKYDTRSVSLTLWGARAEAMAKILKTGMPLIVTGSVTTNANNGRTYYNMSVQNLVLYPKPADSAAAASANNTAADPVDYDEPVFDGAPVPAGFQNASDIDDSDNELPF